MYVVGMLFVSEFHCTLLSFLARRLCNVITQHFLQQIVITINVGNLVATAQKMIQTANVNSMNIYYVFADTKHSILAR